MGTTDSGKTPGKQPSQQSPKGLIYYFLTIFLVTMLLNALVFPNVMKKRSWRSIITSFWPWLTRER